jgi:DNA-binding NarL/FixJ family response regulator
MRAGLRELLTADPEIAVVGEAASGRAAVDQVEATAPDVVLMDVRMPDLDGIEATRLVTSHAPAPRVLILTTFEEDDYLFGALRAGASGFLLKRTEPEQLIAAVHTVAAGDSLLSPSITGRVIERIAAHPAHPTRQAHLLEGLTERERDVCLLLAQGRSNREIAARLVVEESTIRTHVGRILAKLQLRDRVQVVIWAYENGVIAPGREAAP